MVQEEVGGEWHEVTYDSPSEERRNRGRQESGGGALVRERSLLQFAFGAVGVL